MFEKRNTMCLRKRILGLPIGFISSACLFIFIIFICPSPACSRPYTYFFPFVSNSKTITLAWDQNLEPDLAGYKLYVGNSSGKYNQVITLGLTNHYTFSLYTEEVSFFFAITAYTQNGLESGFSNEVQYP